MWSGMTKRNIQNELRRFESLKTDTHKVNRLTGILHSRMQSCTHARTHTHKRPGVSAVCVKLGRLRHPVISADRAR